MRLNRAALLLLLALAVSACRPRRDLSQYTIEDQKANLLSELNLGNPAHAVQLKSGFHQIEENAWRWTEPKFTVELKAPFAGQKVGATLLLAAAVPDILILKSNGPVTIAAKLNGAPLGQQTYPKAGPVDFRADVPAAMLRADTLLVEFTITPGLAPNSFPGDGRALGLIVSKVALEKKTL
jgi:hypothetical protein